MSDWQDFCDAVNINSSDPEQFERLLESWSKEEFTVKHRVNIKEFFQSHANQHCDRCGGTGYIGNFKHVESGRCFKCYPDEQWGKLAIFI